MDGANGQPERLEDQLRRMILTGASSPTVPENANQQFQPTVRLPPTAPPHATQQYQSPQPPQQRAPSQGWQHGHPGPLPSHPGPPSNMQPQRQQNGRHRPPQHQGQFVHQGNQRQFNRGPVPPSGNPAPNQRSRQQQQMPLDPNAFRRGGFGQLHMRQGSGQQQLFNPNQPRGPHVNYQANQHAMQTQFLEQIAAAELGKVEMSPAERDDKESFRTALETVCHEVCSATPERLPQASLECFGSFKSGFATEGSDMDLAIVVKDNSSASACYSLLEGDLPRVLEKRLLQLGYGARLLTRTRVPIIKVCEKPDACFLDKLRQEREKWDFLPDEKKYPHLYAGEDEGDANGQAELVTADREPPEADGLTSLIANGGTAIDGIIKVPEAQRVNGANNAQEQETTQTRQEAVGAANGSPRKPRHDDSKPWTRERKAGPLDFPKTGVGIQSDINFFNPLGLHNTQMLRCYSLCDPRVRPMVQFIKAWAKTRKINSSYSGTLSSYGYVLMVLHFLVNVAQPPVLPNLQSPWRPLGNYTPASPNGDVVDFWCVNFWRNEDEITTAAQRGQLTLNQESLGSLLARFFQYYSSQGGGVTFRWMQEVLSLRSPGGLLTKEEKGWVKAVTEEGDGKKIQHRYLFCIEDPFELNHNVARTVTHKGIVAIRDEFRRARRIVLAVGSGVVARDGELFAPLVEVEDFQNGVTSNGNAGSAAYDDRMAITRGLQHGKANHHTRHPVNQQVHPSKTQDQQLHTPSPRTNKRATSGFGAAVPPKTKQLEFHDSDAFPALGGPKSAGKDKSGRLAHVHGPSEDFSEISGEKAKAVLEEVKRKRDEAQAESTAMGAAEAVLGDE